MNTAANMIDKKKFLAHWQGHRSLTRRVIEKFPEEELFTHRVGEMRPFADMVKELLSIGLPGLLSILENSEEPFNHDLPFQNKAELLEEWDRQTPLISETLEQIDESRFSEKFNLFGAFNFPIEQNLLYFVDNEIHHRGQGFVYLRTLGIEPPMFWDRD
ncbi:MAG: DinB family protein [Sphingobacterium sp.]